MADQIPKYSREEFSRRGEEIFKHNIRPKVAHEDPNNFVAIDIETGEFEVATELLEAIHQLRQRSPGAQIWTRRVGSRDAMRIGGRPILERP